MRYFNGFCLSGEQELFKDILISSDYTLAGFSYGAILAFEEAMKSQSRVDRLILISPAFFQNRAKRYKTLQLSGWRRDRESYIQSFLDSCAKPSDFDLKKYRKDGRQEELKFLLEYEWKRERLEELNQKGVTIELFLGAEDKIVRSDEVLEFFDGVSISYLFKSAGHILR